MKLNLGCGSIRPKGWINTDSSLNANIQRIPFIGKRISKIFNPIEYKDSNLIYMNLNRPWKYKDNSVDIVYASHLFEHLSLRSANLFLQEAYRVLRPGGVIRIVVPDLYKIAKEYIHTYENTEKEDPTQFIMWAINLHREGQYGNPNWLKRIVLEWQGYPHQHKYMYDEKSLRIKFNQAGFKDILSLTYGSSTYINEIADVEGTKESYLSVYLEGRK
ncbi:MAG: methyltransferase domain-containing protein [Bacteroidetes bacterium]|nr:methyltransferase domain-containing protein [Bacteroidota bacterium]